MTEVKTQAALDKALAKTNQGRDEDIDIVGGKDLRVGGEARINAIHGNATVRYVCDNATVRYVYGNATVHSVYGNATVHSVCGNATVRYVCDNATVRSVCDNATVHSVCGNATVRSVCGNATVRYVYGNATVHSVCGNATVHSVCGNATVRSVSGNATVHVHGERVALNAEDSAVIRMHVAAPKVVGGTQIEAVKAGALTAAGAVERWGLASGDTEGTVRLYKAVNDDLKSGRGFAYPIGEEVVAPDWNELPECGGGLHVSPWPDMAHRYFEGATRWLAIDVKVEDLALCSTHEAFPDKAKFRAGVVACEVDYQGRPLEVSDAR